MASAMNLQPGTLIGHKYVLERRLASGGMGSVWLARHLALDAPVAVKLMLDSDATPTARARFDREAKALAQLRSPHVVQILDYGVDEGMPFLVMERLEGEDLSTRLAREGRLSLRAVADIVVQIAKGLEVAHEAGIVHRDLKPSNVFLATAGGEETAKLLDFGVAKIHGALRLGEGADATATGELVGSPEYMSPEQARGGTVDARTDLWALALVAFVALTGHKPFAGTHLGDVLVRICTADLPAATTLVPELPSEIDAFFARALCRSPDGRYPSSRALAAELAAIALGSPGTAGTTSGRLASTEPPVPRADATMSIASPAVASPPSSARRRIGARARWGSAGVGLVAVGLLLWLWPAAHRVQLADASTRAEGPTPAVSIDSTDPTPAAAARTNATDAGASSPPQASTRPPRRADPAAPAAPRRRQAPSPAGAPAVDPKFGLPVGP